MYIVTIKMQTFKEEFHYNVNIIAQLKLKGELPVFFLNIYAR